VRWAAGRRAAIAAALLVAGAAGGYRVWRDAATPVGPAQAVGASTAGGIRTVAVLPFVNTSGSTGEDYFSDGLTDELAHALARLPGMRLAGRTSSYTFKGKAVAAQEIGRTLGVGAIVNGTVRRAGDRLRVTTQLVSTPNGEVLWDSVYESRPRDVFAVQDEFTRAIVAALAPALGGGRAASGAAEAGRGTTDQKAYDLYLKGRYYWLQRGADNVALAIDCFRQAIARDPSFARAHAGLATAYSVLAVLLPDATDSATARGTASAELAAALTTASAERAVALDSTLVDAQLAVAISLDLRLRFRDALARYRTAVATDPSSVTAYHWLGLSLLNLGYADEAVVELRHATELDPLAKMPATAVSTALLFAGRFPEAEAAARRALALDSTFQFAILMSGESQTFNGHPDGGVWTLERGARLYPTDSRLSSALLFAYAASGRWADAERVRAQLRRPGGDLFGGVDVGIADLVFGDAEPLARSLSSTAGQRAYIHHGGIIGCNPFFDPLWTDARFRAAMRRLTVEPCRPARPWPFPTRRRAVTGRSLRDRAAYPLNAGGRPAAEVR
jgi:serine/threonine-protein kinase